MRLNHLQLMVADVEAAASFLTTYFGLTAQPGDGESGTMLTDSAGLTLSLLEGQDHAYPKSFHIGFALPTRTDVGTLRQRLEQDGQQTSGPEDDRDGPFHVMAPGGMMIEVLAASGPGDPPAGARPAE